MELGAAVPRKKVPLDELHLAMQKLFVTELQILVYSAGTFYDTPLQRKMSKQIDTMLNTCDGGEFCEQCADVFCPYGEQLHFHHDGCPCCDGGEFPQDETALRLERWKMLLQRNTRA